MKDAAWNMVAEYMVKAETDATNASNSITKSALATTPEMAHHHNQDASTQALTSIAHSLTVLARIEFEKRKEVR